MINETGEDLVVQTGLDFVTQTVLEDSRMVVSVVKGAEITARGKTTGKQYGPVEFQYDADWFVLPV